MLPQCLTVRSATFESDRLASRVVNVSSSYSAPESSLCTQILPLHEGSVNTWQRALRSLDLNPAAMGLYVSYSETPFKGVCCLCFDALGDTNIETTLLAKLNKKMLQNIVSTIEGGMEMIHTAHVSTVVASQRVKAHRSL
jgi:hypothetical protein